MKAIYKELIGKTIVKIEYFAVLAIDSPATGARLYCSDGDIFEASHYSTNYFDNSLDALLNQKIIKIEESETHTISESERVTLCVGEERMPTYLSGIIYSCKLHFIQDHTNDDEYEDIELLWYNNKYFEKIENE